MACKSDHAVDVFRKNRPLVWIYDKSLEAPSGNSLDESMYDALADSSNIYCKGSDREGTYATAFWEEHRIGLDPKLECRWERLPADGLRFESGGLCDGMHILCHRENGISGKSDLWADRRPSELYA